MNRKTHLTIVTVALCLFGALACLAGKDHISTPKNGRALEKTSPLAEFVVAQDRSVTIFFYNTEMKPVTATTQGVTVIANAAEKATIDFEKRGDVMVSKTPLPAGENYLVVVQFKQTADAKPTNYRFKLQLHECGECKRQEYACICGH